MHMLSDDLDLVVITESWINETLLGDRIQDYEIDNYDIFTYQRKDKMGGGILVYAKRKLKAFVMNHLNMLNQSGLISFLMLVRTIK